MAEAFNAYDMETERLGAGRPEAPCPELLVEWTTGQNAVQYRRRQFKAWLE